LYFRTLGLRGACGTGFLAILGERRQTTLRLPG
jgi:hypothetical protein